MNKIKRVACVFFMAPILLCTMACGANPSAPAPILQEPLTVLMSTAFVTRGTVQDVENILPGITRIPTTAAHVESGSGRVGVIYAWPGDTVYENQVVARLDTSNMDAAIEALEQSVEQLRTQHRIRTEELTLQISTLEFLLSDADDDEAIYGQIQRLRLERNHAVRRHEFDMSESGAALSYLRGNLGQTEIRAPFAGEVVYSVVPGTWVNAGDSVAYVSGSGNVFAEYIGGTLIRQRVERWQPARLQGVVGRQSFDIALIPLGAEERRNYRNRGLEFPIRFELLAEAGDLPPTGETVFIRVYSTWVEDTLRVPSNALFRAPDFVYRITDGNLERVYVVIGAATDFYTEILSGLNEGDEIFVRP